MAVLAGGAGEQESPLSRGRGSKPPPRAGETLAERSPLSRGRGSKPADWRVCQCNRRRPSRGGVDRNIHKERASRIQQRSPLSRGRGSKHRCVELYTNPGESPLSRGRGSKHNTEYAQSGDEMSPLSRGRGSKLLRHCPQWRCHWSPLSRGRGSKRHLYRRRDDPDRVAPLAGAWIETGPCALPARQR